MASELVHKNISISEQNYAPDLFSGTHRYFFQFILKLNNLYGLNWDENIAFIRDTLLAKIPKKTLHKKDLNNEPLFSLNHYFYDDRSANK